MNFDMYVKNIKNKFTRDQIEIYDSIISYDKLKLSSMGHNDTEGYQIFTPEFIVRDMCAAIGDDILDFSKNVLEPTSGDGAFTTFILEQRLKTIKDNFEVESLRALASIYSIEMDKELIEKQRNNIFTLVKLYIKKKKITVDDSYYEILKCIITTNFIWAMFNSDRQIDMGLLGTEVAYKMPQAEKNDFQPLDMPVWEISNDSIKYHEEGVDLW